MKSIELALSYRCNNHCLYCMLPHYSRDASMPPRMVAEKLGEAKRAGADNVLFSGGEPTIISSLPKYARIARELGFSSITVRTNAMMTAYPEFVTRMSSAGVTRWSVSLKSHEQQVHDSLSLVDGGFPIVLKGLDNLTNAGCAIECDFLIHARNFRRLPDAVAFFIERGIVRYNFQLISSWFAPTGKLHDLLTPIDDIAPFFMEAAAIAESCPQGHAITYDIPPCFTSGNGHFFRDLKSVGLVVTDPGGHSFPVDSSPLHGKTRIPACSLCPHSTACDGLRDDYIEIFGFPASLPVFDQ